MRNKIESLKFIVANSGDCEKADWNIDHPNPNRFPECMKCYYKRDLLGLLPEDRCKFVEIVQNRYSEEKYVSRLSMKELALRMVEKELKLKAIEEL